MLREAASVILLRREPVRGYRVLLVRRRRGASFMASACVFPGGGVEADDPAGEARVTAARELFEEAGILLTTPAPAAPAIAALRAEAAGGRPMAQVLAGAGLAWDLAALRPWTDWHTPSVEPRRFSARFFVAECPPDQVASVDDHETVELVWVTPSEAIVRAGELALPPPQIHTLWQLMRLPTVDDVLAQAAAHAPTIAPILPRAAPDPAGLRLLLPWDPAYAAGDGDALALPTPPPPWATGKSRFLLTPQGWRYDHAPVDGPA